MVPRRLCEFVIDKLELPAVDEAYVRSELDELVAAGVLDIKMLVRSGSVCVETRLVIDSSEKSSLETMVWVVTTTQLGLEEM